MFKPRRVFSDVAERARVAGRVAFVARLFTDAAVAAAAFDALISRLTTPAKTGVVK